MARIEGKDVQDAICRVFGVEPEDLTPAQVFTLVKIIKHCRLRCRNNAALHNWLRRSFPALDISTVKMPSKFGVGSYDALRVVNPSRMGEDAQAVEQEEDERGG